MDASYTPYLDWIDSQKPTLLRRVKQWVAINTFSLNVAGLNQLLPKLQDTFKVLEGESRCIELPPQKILDSDGNFKSQPLGHALVIAKRPQASLQILFGGHFDTVYSPSVLFQNVEEVENDIWKGPGVADMKGGIAILLTALEAFERSPFAQYIGWKILLTPDEEIGSPGSAPLYETAAKHFHFGLIFEPSFPDGAFVSQRKGSTTFTIVVQGKAAHVGRDFAQGRSAVFPLVRFIHNLEKLFSDPDLIVNVADVEAKGPVNIVPSLAHCRVNLRSSNLDTLEKASKQLKLFALQSETEGIKIEVVQDSFRAPKYFDSETQHLFQVYASCAQELNIPFQLRSTGGVCDGNILAGAGLPTLDTAGAVGGALHTLDEYLILSSLVDRAKLAALFLFKLASQQQAIQKGAFHG
jgi:glutamate carboxypeptidase